jgi:uncharacterized protein YggE
MSDQPVVVVRGEATREVPPELASFTVHVSARDKDRQTTLTRLTDRADKIRGVLDAYPDAIERRETSGVHIRPELKRGSERVTGYAGTVSTSVTVTDFEILGELLLRLAGEDQTSVNGPWWQLRPGSRAGADVRKDAVADALTRAREYAEAVGARVEGLVEIRDDGAVGGGFTPMMARAASLGSMGGEEPQLELDPELQTVNAGVVMTVRISAPTL